MVRAAEELESHLGIESHLQAHHVLEDFQENLFKINNVKFIKFLAGLLFSLLSWNSSCGPGSAVVRLFVKI